MYIYIYMYVCMYVCIYIFVLALVWREDAQLLLILNRAL